ncbi:MAG: hypothetical protein RBS28_03245 [Rhodocyclaceae bacterium]|jgi:hypothetical protein|nr:hypothetical protein [Rhodocyclaceae bacterium]
MPQRRVLFLDTSHLSAYRVGGGKVEREGSFVADAAGLQAFAAYLAHHRRSLFMLLADVVEEGFQLEDIPFSSGKDRIAIIKRKLAQFFYGTPLSVARSQGRLKTGRRDERLLLMALTQPQQFEAWLDALRTAHANLVGIYTVAQLVPVLLPANAPSQQLIITQTRSGLRQSFFVDRQLRFSRLTPLATGSSQESAVATSIETAKMHQYLSSQRLIDRDRPLATRVLVHPAQLAALRDRCRDSAILRFEFADLLQEEKRTRLHTPIADSQADMLFCHLLAKNAPADQFARSAERRFYRLWQTRFALRSASAVIIAGGLLFAAKLGLDMFGLQESTEQMHQQTRIDQQRYDAALQALPKIPLSTADLRALVDRYDGVAKRAQGPAPLLTQLSHSLDAFPGIAIERLEWKIVEQPEPLPPGQPPALPGMTRGPYAQAHVFARLPIGMVGDQRGQLNLVGDFTKHLGNSPDTQVVILQPPVDTQSGKTLKSGDERSTPEAPAFSFRLIRKL